MSLLEANARGNAVTDTAIEAGHLLRFLLLNRLVKKKKKKAN